MTETTTFLVGTFKPFWRYAVTIKGSPGLPAIPYYKKSTALAWMRVVRAELPWTTPLLLRRRLFRRVEVLDA